MAEKKTTKAAAKQPAEVKATATKAYFDTQFRRIVEAGEELSVDAARAEQLKAAGVAE